MERSDIHDYYITSGDLNDFQSSSSEADKVTELALHTFPTESASSGPITSLLGRFVGDGQYRQFPTPFKKGKFAVYRDGNHVYKGISQKLGSGGYSDVRHFKGAAIKLDLKNLTPEERALQKLRRKAEKANLDYLFLRTNGVGIQKRGKIVKVGSGGSGFMGPLYLGDGYGFMRMLNRNDVENFKATAPLFKGLHNLFKASIHHGDIKPENILYDDEGPVLADFEGARDYLNGATIHSLYFTTEKHYYDLIEKTGKKKETACKRHDLYSLGCAVLMMMTKTYPTEELASMPTPMDMHHRIKDDEVRDLLEDCVTYGHNPNRVLANIIAYFK